MRRITIHLNTTGTDSWVNGIMEVAAVVMQDGEEKAHFTSLSNPGEKPLSYVDITPALFLTGITKEQIRAAEPQEAVAERLRAFLVDWCAGATLHGYNAPFISQFLAVSPWSLDKGIWSGCIMDAAMKIMGPKKQLRYLGRGIWKWPRMDEAVKFFEVEPPENHGALPYARCAARILEKMMRAK